VISHEEMGLVGNQVFLSGDVANKVVYGDSFPDENFLLNHTRAGLLAMVTVSKQL
jgi:hypothetical protein